ncbi:MAG: flavodoxin [Culturomica sp.]|jgi:flavodoxin|nr:flavodoxin [Culturomica sp.]
MKLVKYIIMATTILSAVYAEAQTKKVLVAYYSWSGNTRVLAQEIQKQTGADIFEIVPAKAYSTDFQECVKVAREEIDNIKAGSEPPALKGEMPDLSKYSVIFIGSPNWCSTIAPPVNTFLKSEALAGKTVVPFCTHGTGGRATLFTDMKALAPKATFLEGYSIAGKDVKGSAEAVSKWLKEIKLLK